MKFYTHKNTDCFRSLYPHEQSAVKTDFLMALENGNWFFATKEGELITEDSFFFHIFDNAVSEEKWIETTWPKDWKPLIKA